MNATDCIHVAKIATNVEYWAIECILFLCIELTNSNIKPKKVMIASN